MKPLKDHLLLLKKAKEDEELLRSILNQNQIADSIFGFHAQQAVEKLMKAVLSELQIAYPKTHDLAVLIDLLKTKQISLPIMEDELEWLAPYAVAFRYDDTSDESLDRTQSLQIVTTLRNWVEQRFRKA